MAKLLLPLILVGTLAGCVKDPSSSAPSSEATVTKYSVKFYDGETVLREVQLEEGTLIERPVDLESKSGHTFMNWYATRSLSHKFNFSTPVTTATNVYAGFSVDQADTRDFYILGSGVSNLLVTSSWGTNITDDHKLVKTEGKNEYKITLDLIKGDEFQFGGPEWIHKRGFGYLEQTQDSEGNVVFSGTGGGFGEVTAKGRNIKVEMDGNYTMSLYTYPGDDTYNTDDPSYTDAKKEIYNLGTYDYITWVRNGDPISKPVVITDFYLKGSGLTEWAQQSPVYEIFNSTTKFNKVTDVDQWNKTVYIEEGEEFLIVTTLTVSGTTSSGNIYIRHGNLDEASKDLFDKSASSNLIVKKSGEYNLKITLDQEAYILSATLDESVVLPEVTVVLAGKFGEYNWNTLGADENSVVEAMRFSKVKGEEHKYEITMTFAVGDEFGLDVLKAGATGRGQWGTEGWNQILFAKGPETMGNADFDLKGNIKVLTAGTYKIVYNHYSRIITITAV